MASRYKCLCGTSVFTNLYAGNNVHLLVHESLTQDGPNTTLSDVSENVELEDVLSEIVDKSDIVAICQECGRLTIIDINYRMKLYEPVDIPSKK